MWPVRCDGGPGLPGRSSRHTQGRIPDAAGDAADTTSGACGREVLMWGRGDLLPVPLDRLTSQAATPLLTLRLHDAALT